MEIVCLGLSHRNADVSMRERFAVAEGHLADAVRALTQEEHISEAVIVSTCNRVEYYGASENCEVALDVFQRHMEQRGQSSGRSDLFYKYGGPDSVRHLFRVVSGLESMVLGETEILGQVKKAYQGSVEAGTTARHLNKLFQRAFNVAKEVRSKTNITRGPVSVGAAAVELAEKIFGKLSPCKVMVLGAGETGEQTARALISRGVKTIFVANRSHDRGVALATDLGGAALRFEEWEKWCDDIDILIGSTAAPHAIVTRGHVAPVMAKRVGRPLFLIDLAVPRDVDPAVNKLDGVYLYDIDSLQAIANQSINARKAEIVVCEKMIDRHVSEFGEWLRRGIPVPGGDRPLTAAAEGLGS